jgi:hypothetical protein
MTRTKRRPASSMRSARPRSAASARIVRIVPRAAILFCVLMGILSITAAGCGADNGVVGGVCAPGYTECSAYCVDLNIDPLNCGVCANPCTGGLSCAGGTCGAGFDATVDGDATDDTADGEIPIDERPRCDASDPCRTDCRPPPGAVCTDSGEGGPREGGEDGPPVDGGDAEVGPGSDADPGDVSVPDADAGDTTVPDADAGDADAEASDACTPPYNSVSHCGACDIRCQPLEVCGLNGTGKFTCQPKCTAPLINCFGTCVNLLRDPLNCGQCGNVCPSRLCVLGTCQGEVAGNAVVIGHDFLQSAGNTQQVKLLDNAVFVNNTTTLKILTYERYANPTAAARVRAFLASYASTHNVVLTITPTIKDDDIAAVDIKKQDMVLIFDQPNAPAGAMAAFGARVSPRFAAFTIGGGIIITLDGGQGIAEMPSFTTNAGILASSASTVLVSGAPLRVVATNDALSRGLVNQYAADVNTVRITTSEAQSAKTIFVVIDQATGQPVVVHKIVN